MSRPKPRQQNTLHNIQSHRNPSLLGLACRPVTFSCCTPHMHLPAHGEYAPLNSQMCVLLYNEGFKHSLCKCWHSVADWSYPALLFFLPRHNHHRCTVDHNVWPYLLLCRCFFCSYWNTSQLSSPGDWSSWHPFSNNKPSFKLTLLFIYLIKEVFYTTHGFTTNPYKYDDLTMTMGSNRQRLLTLLIFIMHVSINIFVHLKWSLWLKCQQCGEH